MTKQIGKILFFTVLILSACSKSTITAVSEISSLKNEDNLISALETSEVLGTAKLFTNMSIDNALCVEVHDAVTRAIEYGLDEDLFIRELWMDESSIKVKSPEKQSVLKSRIDEQFSKCITKSMDAEEYYSNSDIVIYWPYSDNWDGVSMPTIVSAPDDPNQDWNYGYKYIKDNCGSVKVDTVVVNDDYAYENPVWVINHCDYDYNDLPFFNQGVNSIDNRVFIGGKNVSSSSTETKSGDSINIWYFRRMQCRHQYDSIFNGGSNFKATVTYLPANGKVGGNTIFHITFTRKQIRKHTIKTVDALMNTDWTEDEISNHLFMIETDNYGTEISTTVSAKYKDESGDEMTYSNTIKYTTADTEVVSQEYKRTYAFSSLGQSEQIMDRGYISYWMEVVNYTE